MGSMERLVGELLTLSRMEGEKVRRGIKPLNLTDLPTMVFQNPFHQVQPQTASARLPVARALPPVKGLKQMGNPFF